jgi:thiamine-monophosphate kinase
LTSRPGEFELISRYFAPLAAGNPGALGLTDDAATLDPGAGYSIVVTADALVAGVHFLPDDPPDQIAAKLLRVSLSDLAAMGAEPMIYVMTMAMPRDWTEEWIAAFADGLKREQETYGILLAGGDTVSTPGPLTLSLTALGRTETGTELRRSGARDGETIWVTGSVGDAALGLRVVEGELGGLSPAAREFLTGRFRLPRPRVTLGPRLRGIASAAIDVSDGLIADLGHICETSGVGAEIRAGDLPLSDAAREAAAAGHADPAMLATGGDDYELLFTAPDGAGAMIDGLGRELGIAITAIGRTTADGTVRLLDANGAAIAMPSGGFRHF